MKITVKIDKVEVTYEVDDMQGKRNNAAITESTDYDNCVNSVLLKTISHIADEARKSYKDMYKE